MNDIRFDQVMERLKLALKLRTYTQLSEVLGLKTNAFYNRKASGSIPYREVVSAALSSGVSIDWIFTGEGTPRRDNGQLVAPVAEIEPRLLAEIDGEIWLAFGAEPPLVQMARVRGALAALIFNQVAFIRSDRARSGAIRNRAQELAKASEWLNP